MPIDTENLAQITKDNLEKLIGEQKTAYLELIEFMNSGKRLHTFEGYAGVGKSFLINMLVNELITLYNSKICISAPTHKALRVLTQMREESGGSENVDYSTIHSLLQLRPVINNRTGEEMFVKDNNNFNSNDLSDYNLLIIDEASMIDDKIFGYTFEEVVEWGIKVIFVGDGKQLPPVNHASSIPMSKDKRESFDIGYTRLTEIVRQRGDNPIIGLSKEIRDGSFKPVTKLNADGHGIIVVQKQDYVKVLERMFASEHFHDDQNYCRVVAWTNKVVDYYNDMIRKIIYKDLIMRHCDEQKRSGIVGKDEIMESVSNKYPFYKNGVMKLPYITIGDILIANKPIFDETGKQIVFNTNEELIVEDYVVVDKIVYGEVYSCYEASVLETYSGKRCTISICHEDSQRALDIVLDKFSKRAIKEKDYKKRSALWTQFYSIKKQFADIKYAPCLTTYKSQGSTYDNIIILANNIISNPKKQEVLQHLYVGVTRASKRCFIFV